MKLNVRLRHRFIKKPYGLSVGALGALTAGLVTALALSSVGAAASTTGFTPAADAFVYGTYPDRNYGADEHLRLDGSPCCMRSFLKFDLSGLDGAVTSATLRIYANSSQSTGWEAHAVNSNWTESGITFANAPSLGAPVGASGPISAGTWTQVDVTQLVSGNGEVSIGLDTTSETQLSLSSREGAHPPQLMVTTGSATTTTGTTGTTGTTTTSTTTTTTGTTTTGTTTTAPPPPGPCGSQVGQTSTITKVMWIVMENHDYSSIVGSSSAPFENQIATECGLATNYHAVSHPSLPNYVALTSGSTQGITDDSGPSTHPLDVSSIYHQAYPSAKGYAESMPSSCDLSDSGEYAVRHAPWAYYINGAVGNQRTECQANEVPLGADNGGTPTSGPLYDDVTGGTLPKFSFVTPNLCNDMHDCSISTGDGWLSNFVPFVIGGSDYRSGRLAIIITFDENAGTSGNQVYTAVVSPFTAPGTESSTSYTHYSLLRTTEEILSVPLIGNAASASSMRSAFGL